jgi:hypothetical protein
MAAVADARDSLCHVLSPSFRSQRWMREKLANVEKWQLSVHEVFTLLLGLYGYGDVLGSIKTQA